MRAMRLGRKRPPRTRPAHVGAVSDEPAHVQIEPCERELASRQHDGMRVVLLWDPRDDAVAVSVADRRNGHSFRFAVDGARALEAFRHPFAYAP